MSLTKKEFMMAVKLCSDVAVQRGLPNMRLRAAKNFHSKGSFQITVVANDLDQHIRDNNTRIITCPCLDILNKQKDADPIKRCTL